MKRREFITGLGGAAAWSFAANAQPAGRLRRIGVLMNYAATETSGQENLTALIHGLRELGWNDGQNLRIDIRWNASDSATGGLMEYGSSTDFVNQFRRAATYLDRILRGDKPGDLPVQEADRYRFVINLKTAKMLGLTIPPGIRAIADEVIE